MLNAPRKAFARSMLAQATLAALLGMTVGCGASSPAGPTPTPVPPAPVPVPVPPTLEGISLMASPSFVTSGDQLAVTWVGPSGRGCVGGGDWIALYKVGDPDSTGAANGHSDIWFDHLCGLTSGTFKLSAPSQPGQYEFRYMAGATSVARSNPVTVSASGSKP